MATKLSKIGWWERTQYVFDLVLTLLVFLTFLYVVIFILPRHMQAAQVFEKQWVNTSLLWVHAICAIPPLLIGSIAFSKKHRNKHPKFHRKIGTVYCLGIWISALTGIILASANNAGMAAKFGFGTLGVAWYLTTYFAYKTARAKDFVSHRRWMIRSYALTLAVVSVRGMFWFPPESIDTLTWRAIVSWLCWVPNIILGETYVRITTPTGKLRKFKRRESKTVAA